MAKKQRSRAKVAAPSRRRVTPLRGRSQPAATGLDLHRCVLFLEHEARLLDESKFDDWLALFTADAWYWVPSEPNQDNPHDIVSLIYDDRRLLETRVRRLGAEILERGFCFFAIDGQDAARAGSAPLLM